MISKDTLHDCVIEWAKADRAADIAGAELVGIERTVSATPPPIPVTMIAELARCRDALRVTCQAEQRADEKFREVARAYLEQTDA